LKDNTTHKRLLVGKINGLFGIKGFVKVFSYSDPKEQIVSYKKWLIKDGEGFNEVAISGKKQGKTVIAKLDGVNNANDAQSLLGKEVYIDTSWLPILEDQYYYYQLEGLKVSNTQGIVFGVVDYIFDTGSNTVLVVKDGKTERLIPFIAPYLIDVDLKNQHITVDWDADF
jgi:16S rRNA processing protein RimM